MVETGPSSTHTGTGPLAPGRFSPRNLFLISFSILFVEMAAMIRDAVWAIDADMPVARVRTLDDIRETYYYSEGS